MDKRIFIPFGSWVPDEGDIGNSNLFTCRNVIPYANGYLPVFPTIKKSVNISVPLGFGVHRLAGNTAGWKIYYGSSTELFEVDPDTDPWPQSDLSGATYSVGDFGWVIVGFGKHVVATCGNGSPVQYRASGAGNFADLITSTEKPRFNFVVPLEFQLLGVGVGTTGLTSGPSGDDVVWWSDFDDIRTFLHAGTLSDNNIWADDYGGFTGAIGNLDFGALLFKKNSIVMFVNTGPSGPQMRTVWKGDGTIYHDSIFAKGDKIYFWETSGQPCFWDGNSVVKISEGTLFQALSDSNRIKPGLDIVQEDDLFGKVFGVYDAALGNMHFLYRSLSSPVADLAERILHINVDGNNKHNFSISDVTKSSGSNYQDTNSLMYGVFSVPENFGFSDSPSLVYAAQQGIGSFTAFVVRDEASGDAIYDSFPKFGTGFLTNPKNDSDGPLKTWQIRGVKPIVTVGDDNDLDGALPAWRAVVTGKQFPWDMESSDLVTKTFESTDGLNNGGYLGTTNNGPGFKYFNKVDVEFDIKLRSGDIPQMVRQFIGIELLIEEGQAAA